MKTKQRKSGQAETEILKDIPKACIDENAAVEFMEKQRWGNMPACPRCGDTNVIIMKDQDGARNKRYLWRCHVCKEQFTVRIGTVFEDSRIPLRIWCYAFWRACASKKGISALQISRECSITYKSALFLMHRIRYAMTEPQKQEKLQGIVEADETYVGGKPRYKGTSKPGRGTNKTPVLALVERKGNIRTRVIPSITSKTLKDEMQNGIDEKARIITDEFPLYKNAASKFIGGHDVIRHCCKEYVRGDVYTNTVECFFSLLKRGLYGTFHAISKKHLHRYVNEFAFRWDTRKIDDGARIAKAIKGAEGKRLTYYQPTSKSA